jgi:spermidine synthase
LGSCRSTIELHPRGFGGGAKPLPEDRTGAAGLSPQPGPIGDNLRILKKRQTLPEPNFSDDGPVRHLHLGTPWIQGSMYLADSMGLVHEYIQRMMAWLLFVEPDSVRDRRAMQLGLGAASLTKFCHKELRMVSTTGD